MTSKKIVSIVTSIALLSGALCAAPIQPDGTSLFSAPIVAEAAHIFSGAKSDLVYSSDCIGTKLYFWKDPADGHLEVCGCETNGMVNYMTIPNTFKGSPVTGIRYHAFDGQTNIRQVNNYSGAIKTIGEAAFIGCTNLNSVPFVDQNYKSSVLSVGVCAFQGCTALTTATECISNATEIGAHAFWGCTALTEVKLDAISSLGQAAFYGCTGITKIDLSQSPLTSLPAFAFYHSTAATEIHLPETLRGIGAQAFCGCASLPKIYIPDSVTAINSAAFMNCTALKTVMMSENISTIADHAFFECPNMKFFVSKKKNASIGSWAIGWHLENTLPVRNTDFVIWSTGAGSVKNYATNNGFTYRNISTAASLASDRFVNYEWATTRIADWGVNGKYYFTEQHKPYVNSSWYDFTFSGYGAALETVSVLTSSGFISVSDYAPGYARLRDINPIPQNVSSYVSTINAHDSTTVRDYHSEKKFTKEMLRYAEYITYGADAARMLVKQNSCNGFYAACFGLELKSYASDKNDACWDGWDARIMVYRTDNRTIHNKADYIYVNLTDGSWRIGNVSNSSSYSFTMNHLLDALIYNNGMTAEQFLAAIRN